MVCCRCSPTQKAAVVLLLKSHSGLRTCAIGDGGNDVAMIQAAHIGACWIVKLSHFCTLLCIFAHSFHALSGIGIVGKEGLQASLAADVSITEFQHTARLLLWHGRNAYSRTSHVANFVFHRGLIISVIQAALQSQKHPFPFQHQHQHQHQHHYQHQHQRQRQHHHHHHHQHHHQHQHQHHQPPQAVFSAVFFFAPVAIYSGWLMVGYTSLYTMLPVLSLLLDEDVSAETALTYPEL